MMMEYRSRRVCPGHKWLLVVPALLMLRFSSAPGLLRTSQVQASAQLPPAAQASAQKTAIEGTWQGTLHAGKDYRDVIKITKADDGYKLVLYLPDQSGDGYTATNVTVGGPTLKFTLPFGTYSGRLSSDEKTVTGTWTQDSNILPLVLTRATPETAWEIPPPRPPPKRIPEDADPTFEVATIKPTKEGTQFSIHPTGSGELVATDVSLAYLIKFAYEVHPRQITKGPVWLDTDKYDLTAKPDIEGQPNLKQMRVMVQKLLKDRFQLTFHRGKIELPVYAVTVAKGGPKLTRNDANPDGNPGYGGGPAGMHVMNSTIAEFIGFVLNDSLQLPVVDQTGLGPARYDFTLKWTPDGSQSQPGGGAAGAPPADSADAPPDIFTAMQQQLGLKLESTKTLMDVMVIDHVEKPSPN